MRDDGQDADGTASADGASNARRGGAVCNDDGSDPCECRRAVYPAGSRRAVYPAGRHRALGVVALGAEPADVVAVVAVVPGVAVAVAGLEAAAVVSADALFLQD